MKKSILTVVATVTLLTSGIASANAGQAAYNQFGCAGCHGGNGISSMDTTPNLAGQKSGYTVNQLKAFADGTRADATMKAMAGMVVGKEKIIADYLAGL